MRRQEPPAGTVETARLDLERALHILAVGGRYRGEEWSLIALLIGEADLVLRAAPLEAAAPLLPLRDEAVEALRDRTRGLTLPAYLRSTRPERRRNPGLLNPL
jgi:hypothetical protein